LGERKRGRESRAYYKWGQGKKIGKKKMTYQIEKNLELKAKRESTLENKQQHHKETRSGMVALEETKEKISTNELM
jgi:hypothetical protein